MELLMENLKQIMSCCNDNPLINNNPTILHEKAQVQSLYEELNSMMRKLFVDNENELDELEQLTDIKTRFKDLAEKAYYTVGLFIYSISAQTRGYASTDFESFMARGSSLSLDLEDVMMSIKSMEMEFNWVLEFNTILENVKIDSSPWFDSLTTESVAGTSGTRNELRRRKVLKETIVGLRHDAVLIRDQLTQDQKQLDVVSIVGMGGLGKTTLANIVFNDSFVKYHFHVRAWVTVSQTYDRRDSLIQILTSARGELDYVDSNASVSRLREMLHKRLMSKRFLIVVDDIWSLEAWNDLKLFFPNNHTGSRILLTSRHNEVALHAKSHGYIHQLKKLTDEESWELLCIKVFHGNDCHASLIQPGKRIAKNCHGLPLAVVVIAGVLGKKPLRKDSWEKIGRRVSSYVVRDQNGYVDMLALSYDHLSSQLKNCFLYLGGFPEDHKFRVRKLIWLWIAEGFIQKAANRSLEETGEDYLLELVDRNLVVIADRKLDGGIKSCSLHDLLRELCLVKATAKNFFQKINMAIKSRTSHSIFPLRQKTCRIFTNVNFYEDSTFYYPGPSVQSVLCFHNPPPIYTNSHTCRPHLHYYALLMVLDLQTCRVPNFPPEIELLVHLRYLAFCYDDGLPSAICNLWSLQTLIFKSFDSWSLPINISNLVNLRHLWSNNEIYFRSIEKPMNLQTISKVALVNGAKSWVKYIPGIKKLTSSTRLDEDHDFRSLTSLETLMWITIGLHRTVSGQMEYPSAELRKVHMRLPASLKKLSLAGCCLPWSDMSIVQSLPNLEVLKLLDSAFMGPRWETGEKPFPQLKYMKLQSLNVRQWVASDINFPSLKRLVVERCKDLEEIPLELGDIPTLEIIEVDESSNSVVKSLYKIQEEQHHFGNDDLKINIREELSSHSSWLKLQGVRY